MGTRQVPCDRCPDWSQHSCHVFGCRREADQDDRRLGRSDGPDREAHPNADGGLSLSLRINSPHRKGDRPGLGGQEVYCWHTRTEISWKDSAFVLRCNSCGATWVRILLVYSEPECRPQDSQPNDFG